MKRILRSGFYLLLSFIFLLNCGNVLSQFIISGTVYDSTKLYVVPGVNVSSTSGLVTTTDSLGAYHIKAIKADSISFFYKGKSTIKFPVETIGDYNAFDISLRVRINNKYKLLKGVTVFANTYRRDSIENRMAYSKIFNLENPTIRSNYEPGAAAGLDLDQLIGIFQFKKNKQNLAFQKRLVEEEEDRYVNYRFSSKVINRITGLSGDTLTRYKNLYRPSYLFVMSSTLPEFYQYILNTSYAFKREEGMQ
ncbi:MAG TPA: hypothetical protein VGP55_09785 [Chitinophagaceae bacterium]|nr:hypothetical protein [Chitinophagaceae bacterium]